MIKTTYKLPNDMEGKKKISFFSFKIELIL
jgi:hypothetical protein